MINVYQTETQQLLPEYCVPGKDDDLKKYVTTKDNARVKKDILPPDEYLIPKKIEEKENIVR